MAYDLWDGGDFKSRQALNMQVHNVSNSFDTSDWTDGQLGYITDSGNKHLCFRDTQAAARILVPRLDRAESVTGQWIFAPATAIAPFVLNANAQGQKVIGLNADLLDGFNTDSNANGLTIPVRDNGARMKAATPVADDDVANKAFVLDTVTGIISIKEECRVKAIGNINIATAPVAGSSAWDGITLSNGDRVLLDDQTSPSENGIYIYNGVGSAMTRAPDADSDAEVNPGMTVFISQGNTWGGTRWQLITPDPITVGSTPLDFAQIEGASDITAGPGLAKNANELYVKLGTTGSPAGYSYTQGGIVYASGGATLNHTAALTGILIGQGTGAPSTIGGLTAGRLPRVNSGSPYLVNSNINDNGSTVIVEVTTQINASLGVSGNIIGGNSGGAGASVFHTGISSVKYAHLQDAVGFLVRYDTSSNALFKIENRDITCPANFGAEILVNLADNSSAGAIAAGKMIIAKEQTWTSTASTRDAYFALQLAVNGTLQERFRVSSAGDITFAGNITTGQATVTGLTASRIVTTTTGGLLTTLTPAGDNQVAKWSSLGIIGGSIVTISSTQMVVNTGDLLVVKNGTGVSADFDGGGTGGSNLRISHDGTGTVKIFNSRGGSGGSIQFMAQDGATLRMELKATGALHVSGLTTNGVVQTSGGTGLFTVNNNLPSSATINSKSIARYYTQNLSGTGPTWTVTHNLSNNRPVVMIYDTSTNRIGGGNLHRPGHKCHPGEHRIRDRNHRWPIRRDGDCLADMFDFQHDIFGTLMFRERQANGANWIGFKAPDAITTNVTFTLPSGLPSTNGLLMACNTDGTLYFVTPPTLGFHQHSLNEITASGANSVVVGNSSGTVLTSIANAAGVFQSNGSGAPFFGSVPGHSHSASDINSGILGGARGGLGVDIGTLSNAGIILAGSFAATAVPVNSNSTPMFLKSVSSTHPAWSQVTPGDIAPNPSSTRKFLSSVSGGAPTWEALVPGDTPWVP